MLLNRIQVFLFKLFDLQQRIMSALRIPYQFVQFELNGLCVTILGVLDQEHHQECNNRCARVDNKLPGIAKMKHRARDKLHQYYQSRQRESARTAGFVGRPLSEAREKSFFAVLLGFSHFPPSRQPPSTKKTPLAGRVSQLVLQLRGRLN